MSKTVLITGGAKRVGAAITQALAADGWKVAIHYHASDVEADALADTVGKGAARFGADLTKEEDAQHLVPRVVEHFGQLDAIIHGASLFEKDGLDNFSWDCAEKHQRIHTLAAISMAQHLYTHRLDVHTDEPAQMVLLGDGLKAWSHSAAFLSYGVSCASMESLPPLLAERLAPHITINTLGLGLTLAEESASLDQFERIAQKTPMQLTSSPEEVIATARWLLSSPSVTGQVIHLSGGQHLPRRISLGT